MPSLGSFSAALAEASDEPNTFELEGEIFAVHSQISAHAFLQFSRYAGEIDLSDEEQVGAVQMVVMFDLLRDAIVPEDWDRFQRTVKDKRVGIATIMAITSAIMEGESGRPTERPSGSPGRPSSTSRKSSTKRSGSSGGTASPSGMRPVKKGDDALLAGLLSGQVATLPGADVATG